VSAALSLDEPAGRWALTVTVLGSGVAFLEGTVVNVALPSIGADLGADLVGLQWVLNGYLVTLAALILLGGSLGDRYGRRRIYVIGLVAFAATSALCALAWDVASLVAFRTLQGAAGALVTPGSLAIIQASFRPRDRGRAIGAWSALTGIAAALGPLVGGWLVDVAGWRSVFWLTAAPALLTALLARTHVPESTDATVRGHPDLAGAALGTVGLGAASYALLRAGEVGPGDWTVVVAALFGLVTLVGFVVVERRRSDPMLPTDIFRNGQFVAANAITLVVYAALGGVFFLLIVHLQTVLGYTALQTGAATIPLTLLMLFLSARAGEVAQRIGPRIPLTVGPLLLAVAMVMMGGIEAGAPYWTGVFPAVALFGLGLSATVAPVTATALAAADPEHAGLASGVNNAVSRTAQLLAVAILPLAAGLEGADYQDPVAFADGFAIAMWVAAGLAAAGGAIAWFAVADDVLDVGDDEEPTEPCMHCAVDGAPLIVEHEADAVHP
jgi:EmrB/QacA subfamily drug resistance transporter